MAKAPTASASFRLINMKSETRKEFPKHVTTLTLHDWDDNYHAKAVFYTHKPIADVNNISLKFWK